jgi:hypothetical protein
MPKTFQSAVYAVQGLTQLPAHLLIQSSQIEFK